MASYKGVFLSVSIHAPWEGCDSTEVLVKDLSWSVSIHAPWEGCDELKIGVEVVGEKGFNSRTLGRVRQKLNTTYKTTSFVSIHAPWEGCDVPTLSAARAAPVSIHAPWEGCDTSLRTLIAHFIKVSIHAPWEGCDCLRTERG